MSAVLETSSFSQALKRLDREANGQLFIQPTGGAAQIAAAATSAQDYKFTPQQGLLTPKAVVAATFHHLKLQPLVTDLHQLADSDRAWQARNRVKDLAVGVGSLLIAGPYTAITGRCDWGRVCDIESVNNIAPVVVDMNTRPAHQLRFRSLFQAQQHCVGGDLTTKPIVELNPMAREGLIFPRFAESNAVACAKRPFADSGYSVCAFGADNETIPATILFIPKTTPFLSVQNEVGLPIENLRLLGFNYDAQAPFTAREYFKAFERAELKGLNYAFGILTLPNDRSGAEIAVIDHGPDNGFGFVVHLLKTEAQIDRALREKLLAAGAELVSNERLNNHGTFYRCTTDNLTRFTEALSTIVRPTLSEV